MTATEITAAVVAFVGTGGVGAVLAKLTDRRRVDATIEAERMKLAAEGEARAIGYRDAFIATLQEANGALTKERAAERASEREAYAHLSEAHSSCREEVSALTSRVIVLEGTNAAIANDLRRSRDRIEKLERGASAQNIPAQSKEPGT